jgi:hypothetical protein
LVFYLRILKENKETTDVNTLPGELEVREELSSGVVVSIHELK